MGEDPNYPISLWKIWVGGAVGGLGCWVFSTPTELVKCRAQVTSRRSWDIARELWGSYGVRGLYLGGVVTGVRDSLGFGF